MVYHKNVFRNYSSRDRILTSALAGFIILTLLVSGIQSLIYKSKIADKDDVYTEGLVGELNILNPLFTDFSAINRDISYLIFSGLTKYNPDKKTFEPDLANFTVNDDSTIYTFTLKDDLEWQDGEPVTIDDVLFTYKTVAQDPAFTNNLLKESLAGVEVENTAVNEIQFRLTKPNAFFISITDLGILPKHLYKDIPINEIGYELDKNRTNLLIGTGPYKFEKLESLNKDMTRVSLKYNKKYYDGKPKIKQLRFFIFPDTDTLFNNIDSLNGIPHLAYEQKDRVDNKKFKIQEYILPQYTAIFLNTESPLLADDDVRNAFRLATNKRQLSIDMPSKQIIGKPFFQFEVINEIGEVDIPAVMKILRNNGWYKNEDGILVNDSNEPMQLNLMVQNYENNLQKQADTDKVVNHIIDSYKEIGVQINVERYDTDTFNRLLSQKSYDMVLFGHDLGNNLDSFAFWHSSQTGDGGSNLSNYKNIALDSMLEKLRSTSNIDRRNEILLSINQELAESAPAIFLYTEKNLFAFDNKVKKRKLFDAYTYPTDRFYDVQSWELGK